MALRFKQQLLSCLKSQFKVVQVSPFKSSTVRGFAAYTESDAKQLLSQYHGGRIQLEKDDVTGIASVILNRPEKKNALSGSMMIELGDIVTELEGWKQGKGVVMYGAGNTFCSGADLDLVQQNFNRQKGEMIMRYMTGVLTRFHNLPQISAALIEGYAMGGGSELLTACDFRVVSERVSMGFIQSKLGLSTGFGGGYRLVKMLGRKNALHLIGSGQIISCKRGVDFGLVDAVMPDNDKFVEAGKQWLRDRVVADAGVVQAVKRVIIAVDTESNMEAAQEKEMAEFLKLWGADLHRSLTAVHTGKVKNKEEKS